MTQDEIIEMARQAGYLDLSLTDRGMELKELEAFAKLVAAKAIAELKSQEPVALVGEVHMSRYTIEWLNGPLPEGTELFDHPPQRTEQEQPLPPVEIGVDVTADGASVVAFYRKPNAVMEMFYSQFHPAPQRTEQNFCPRCGKRTNDIHTCTPPQGIYYTPPQRTWVGLTGEMLLKAAQSSLAPEQYDHFEAMSKHQPDIYDRLAYAIRVQDE